MIGKNEKAEIYKAINNVSKKINDVEYKLDEVLHYLHLNNAEKITDNENGILDMADSVSVHDEAIMELAELISNVETAETNNTTETEV